MSGISSLGTSGASSILDYLKNSTKSTSVTGPSPFDEASSPQQGQPLSFLTSELQEQGISGTDLQALLKKIQEAADSVPKDKNGRPDRAAIRDAVHQVLKDAGVDTDKIDRDLKAKAHARTSDGLPGTDLEIDALLESLGVNPAKFKLALQTAIQNSGNDGSIDLSQLFASAAVGSQVDLLA